MIVFSGKEKIAQFKPHYFEVMFWIKAFQWARIPRLHDRRNHKQILGWE